MLFPRKKRTAMSKGGRRVFAQISVALILLSILQKLDFSEIGVGSGIVAAVFAIAWMGGAYFSAKRRWMPFRLLALTYWGAAVLSAAAQAALMHWSAQKAGWILGRVQYLLSELPLRAIFLSAAGTYEPQNTALVVSLLSFGAVMTVFYVTLWRNEKLPL